MPFVTTKLPRGNDSQGLNMYVCTYVHVLLSEVLCLRLFCHMELKANLGERGVSLASCEMKATA